MRLEIWFDGSYGPSQRHGTAAWGYIVKDSEGLCVHAGSGKLGKGAEYSCNSAEYEGLYQAMVFIREYYPEAECVFRGDSALVISQMRGESRAIKGKYLPQYRKTLQFARSQVEAGRWEFQWVSREFNREADELAQQHRF